MKVFYSFLRSIGALWWVTRNLLKIGLGFRDHEIMGGYMDLFLEEHVLQFSAQYRSIMEGYTELIKNRA